MAAASKSKAREPQHIPLPPSPVPVTQASQSNWSTKSRQEPAIKHGWSWTSLTDSNASRVSPIFTKDGSYFFSIVGSSVKIHSVATGQVVSTLFNRTLPSLRREGLSGLITSATLNPHNAFQLITASLDGCIKVWDFLDATLLQTIDLAQPILHICAHERFKDTVFVAATRPTKKKNGRGKNIEDNAAVLSVSLKPSDATIAHSIQQSSRIVPVGKTRSTTGLAVSPNGAWLVAIAGHKAYVATTSALKSGFTKYVSPERLTCLAFHPMDEYFATGDDKGFIRLWYCLNDQVAVNVTGIEKRAQTTTLHWHAHAISSIAFTPNGAYLLSGGEESVLVIWQLHTGKKEFVPRVGSPINTIVVSQAGGTGAVEEEYLLGLADASFVFINAGSLKISRTYSRIKLDPATSSAKSSESTSAPLAVHTLSSTLILPASHPSSLQTYAPSTSKLIAELEVSPSNRVSRRDEKPIEPSRVERVIISSSGEWMATIDSREGDESFRAEVYMKIWWWDRKAGYWILNTRIDRPHGLEKVTAVAFSPTTKASKFLMLVTTGEDATIKTWGIRTLREKGGAVEEYWVARSTFNFRSEKPMHASWSADGSLLAITFERYVALYNPTTNAQIQLLTSSECGRPSSAHFVGRGGRYLAVVGGMDLVLWDLITQSICWHHGNASTINTVVPHPLEESFALFQSLSTQTKLFLFRASEPSPYERHTIPFRLLNEAWFQESPGASTPGSPSFSFVGITSTWSVMVFGHDVHLPDDEGAKGQEIAESSGQKSTLFQNIFGKSAFTDLSIEPSPSSSAPAAQAQASSSATTGIFDAPAYLMPPLESLFEPLMNTYMKRRTEEKDVEGMEGIGETYELRDDDAAMDVVESDDQPLLVGRARRRVVIAFEMDALSRLFSQHAKIPTAPDRGVSHKTTGNGKKKGQQRPAAKQPPANPNESPENTIKPTLHVQLPQPSDRQGSNLDAPAVNGSGKKRRKRKVSTS